MCLGLYLAAAAPLPEITWTAERPAFHATALTADEQAVRGQFTQPYVAYLGSHTQCGCGFSPDGAEDPSARRRSLAALVAYVAAAHRHGPVELFVCWDGDYAERPQRRLRLRPAELLERSDWLDELTLVELEPDAS